MVSDESEVDDHDAKRWGKVPASSAGEEAVGERVVDEVVRDDEDVGVARVLDSVALEGHHPLIITEFAQSVVQRSSQGMVNPEQAMAM